MKHGKIRALVCAISFTTILSFAGLVSGTVAWYANSTRATVSYGGVAVSQSRQLQIGLVDADNAWTPDTDLSLTTDTESISGSSIHWASAGVGFKSAAIQSYLSAMGYASTELEPVTTRGYSDDGTFDVTITSATFYTKIGSTADASYYFSYNGSAWVYGSTEVDLSEYGLEVSVASDSSLIAGDTFTINSVSQALSLQKFRLWHCPVAYTAKTEKDAKKAAYVKLSFAFRIAEATTSGIEYATDTSIYLSDIQAAAAGEGNIKNALRLYVDGESTFLVNPSQEDSGYVNVAGALDLNADGYYDFDSSSKEIVYGDYWGSPTSVSYSEATSSIDDVNLTSYTTETTFSSKHYGGVTGYSATSNPTFANSLTPSKSAYLGINDIKPTDDGYGNLSGGKPISITDEEGLGTADMTVFLEGWDHSVIDAEISHAFNLGLTFQIDRS